MKIKLPLSISTFARLRNEDFLYIDKTEQAYRLIVEGHRYFLSRPRRFGKSLFVSTLKEILSGNRSLFHGLWIDGSDYQWYRHGIVNLDLSAIDVTNAGDFRTGICSLLQEIADDNTLGIMLSPEKPDVALRALVRALYAKFGRVAILVDEYDNPILQVLNDTENALEVRNALRRFFAVIKSLDSFIDFVFITGVSSFAKAGLFSGINNLNIITLDDQYATICGYTDQEVDRFLKEKIDHWAHSKKVPYQHMRQQVKDWYNGYHFGAGVSSVYNPFSIMNALEKQTFKNFWFQSGAPTFLIEELTKEYRKKEYTLLDIEESEASEDALGIFEIGATPLSSLMFQTGYLTVTSYDEARNSYTLGYPNFEVKTALQKCLLALYTEHDIHQAESFSLKLWKMLNEMNTDELIVLLKELFIRVPYHLHMKEEKFYHALLQIAFGAAGLKVYSELPTSHGRIDMVVELPSTTYVIEVKLNEPAQDALRQIEDRAYHENLKYLGKPLVLLGLSFKRQDLSFEITKAEKVIKSY